MLCYNPMHSHTFIKPILVRLALLAPTSHAVERIHQLGSSIAVATVASLVILILPTRLVVAAPTNPIGHFLDKVHCRRGEKRRGRKNVSTNDILDRCRAGCDAEYAARDVRFEQKIKDLSRGDELMLQDEP